MSDGEREDSDRRLSWGEGLNLCSLCVRQGCVAEGFGWCNGDPAGLLSDAGEEERNGCRARDDGTSGCSEQRKKTTRSAHDKQTSVQVRVQYWGFLCINANIHVNIEAVKPKCAQCEPTSMYPCMYMYMYVYMYTGLGTMRAHKHTVGHLHVCVQAWKQV